MAHVWFIYLACSQPAPTRRVNQSAPAIVILSSGSLYHCCQCALWGDPAAGEGRAARTILSITTKERAMQNGPTKIPGARPPSPAASYAARSKRWTSNAVRPDSNNSQNAQRSYERYLALARAEV